MADGKTKDTNIEDVDAMLVTLSLLTLGMSNAFKPLLIAKVAFLLGQAEQAFYDAFMICVVKTVEDAENLARGARYRLREITSTFIKMAGGKWPAWKRWAEDSKENPVVLAFAKGVTMDIIDGVGRDRAMRWVGEDGEEFLPTAPALSEGTEGIKGKIQMSVREINAKAGVGLPADNPILTVLDVYNDEIERSEKLTRTREVALAVFELGRGFPGKAFREVMEKDVATGQASRGGVVKELLNTMFEFLSWSGKTTVLRALKEIVKQKVVSCKEIAMWVVEERVADLEEGSWDMMELLKVSVWERGKAGDNCSFDDDEEDDEVGEEEMMNDGAGGSEKREADASVDIKEAFKVLLQEAKKNRKEGDALNVALNCGIWGIGAEAIVKGIWNGEGWGEGKKLYGV